MNEQLSPDLVKALSSLPEAVNRLHRALIGDNTIGHQGVVERLGILESVERNIPAVHAAIDERRIEGDRRAHGRIDELDDKFEAKIQALDDKFDEAIEANREDGRRIERKLDRVIWLFAGGAAVAGGGLGFLLREVLASGQLPGL